MNTFANRISPIGRRLLSVKETGWTKTASSAFGSLIARNTTKSSNSVPSFPAIKFQGRHSSSESETASLAECLATEIAAEAANDEVDQELLDIKKSTEKIFKICSTEGKGTVHLSKKFKDETIDITFDCQDEAEMDMEDEAIDQAADTEDDEDMPEMEYGINFEVTITKPNGTKMVIACAASQKLVINTVRHIDADKDVADQELYGGPVFDHLDEQLQDAFHAYLSDRNVDEDLCFFILSFSREKEQKEYGAWLNKLLVFAE